MIKNGLPLEIIENGVLRAKELTDAGRAKLTPIVFVSGFKAIEFEELVRYTLEQKADEIVYFAYSEMF